MTGGSAERVLRTVRELVEPLAATFGRTCEVVLHDYRDPERSVVAVAGDVTGREVGDGMSPIGRRVMQAGDAAATELNYVTRTPDGTLVKSTTIPLFEDDGALFGALCINVDVTALGRAAEALSDIIGARNGETAAPITDFHADLTTVTDRIVAQRERAAGIPARAFDREARLQVMQDLEEVGVFERRGAAGVVAARLGISRAGYYNHLRALRETTADAVSE
nr:transcriptional regulator [Actinomycetales bacterium]